MGRKAIDLTGKKYRPDSILTPIRPTGRRVYGGNIVWLCKCDCGNTAEVPSHCIVSGRTRSCGCLQGTGGEHPRSPNRDKAVALYEKGWTAARIAGKLGVSKERVAQYLRAANIDLMRMRKKRTRARGEEIYAELVEAYETCQSRKEIAAALGIAVKTVATRKQRAVQAGYDIRALKNVPRVYDVNRADILGRWDAGESIDDIAQAVGKRPATVRHLVYMHRGTSKQPNGRKS